MVSDACAIVAEVKGGLGGSPPGLMTSDESPAYATAIGDAFSEPVPSVRRPGRPRIVPGRRLPDDLLYATVHKHPSTAIRTAEAGRPPPGRSHTAPTVNVARTRHPHVSAQ